MPKRMIRDWTDSERVNSLSAQAERLFIRLMMKADDFGRFNASPRVLRGMLFPLLVDTVREVDISRWLTECEKAGLIWLYADENGRPLLEIENFGQRMDKAVAKFPERPTVGRSPPGISGNFPPEEKGREEEKEKKGTASAAELVLPFSSEEFRKAWAAFVAMRSETGKPFKPSGANAALEKLAVMGLSKAIESLRNSTAGQWSGLFDPPAKSGSPNQPESKVCHALETRFGGRLEKLSDKELRDLLRHAGLNLQVIEGCRQVQAIRAKLLEAMSKEAA